MMYEQIIFSRNTHTCYCEAIAKTNLCKILSFVTTPWPDFVSVLCVTVDLYAFLTVTATKYDRENKCGQKT